MYQSAPKLPRSHAKDSAQFSAAIVLSSVKASVTRPSESSELFWAHEIAFCYALLRDKQKSLLWLKKTFEDHADTFALDARAPAFEWLHADAAFQALLRRTGLPQ